MEHYIGIVGIVIVLCIYACISIIIDINIFIYALDHTITSELLFWSFVHVIGSTVILLEGMMYVYHRLGQR